MVGAYLDKNPRTSAKAKTIGQLVSEGSYEVDIQQYSDGNFGTEYKASVYLPLDSDGAVSDRQLFDRIEDGLWRYKYDHVPLWEETYADHELTDWVLKEKVETDYAKKGMAMKTREWKRLLKMEDEKQALKEKQERKEERARTKAEKKRRAEMMF